MADKDKKQISFSTEAIILCCALGLGVLVGGEFFWWQTTGFFAEKSAGDQSSQLLILTLGAIGAACGLILAALRSAKFSKQVDTGQKQLFNEQLGRGAELLANDEMVMRQTGIRVLGNLAERTIGEPEQVKLIMQIIHDFVHAKTRSPSEDKETLDIEIGIRTLGFLYNKSGRLAKLEELVQFLGYHLERLNFTDAQLQGVDFLAAELQESYFFRARLQGANLEDAQLQGVDFLSAELQWADCTANDFSYTENLTEAQVKGMVFEVNRPPRLPEGLQNFLDPKCCYELKEDPNNKSIHYRRFVESDAEWSGKRVDEWVNEYITSIRDSENNG